MDTYEEICLELGVGVRGVNEMTNDEIAVAMCNVFDRHIAKLRSDIFSIKHKGSDE